MANGGNRAIAPARKLLAVVLGTVAAFVVLFGFGMGSWSIVALGVALVALAVALATFKTGGRAWVVGVGHVHSASEPPTTYSFGRCELQLLIDAPGLPPRSKKIIEPRVPIAKWPAIGQALPIRVALDDQRRIRVLWDEVPTHSETAALADDLPPEYAGPDPLDEVLIQQDAPPWADRGPDDGYPDGPGPEPLLDDPDRLPEDREPVVVHQRPGGPVVLEGTLVEPGSAALPHRAAPAPRAPAEERFDPPTHPGFGDPYAGPPGDPYAGRPVTPYRDPYDGPPDDPDGVRPASSPYGDPYGGAPDDPDGVRPTGPYRDPYAGPPDAAADAADAADAGNAATDEVPRPRPGDARDDAPEAVGEPISDPVDVPLDPPDGTADPDDGLDEAIFGYDAGADGSASPISGVGITVLVTDLDRSLDFYRDVLGFAEVDRGVGNAVLASGSTRLVLREVSEAAPISRRLVHVNLEVDDIQAAYERLRDSGVRFTYAPRVVNRGAKLDVWAAAFRDPDGHGIALTQWRTRADA
ncbi:VOC family protein [Micromonospora sp. WMMD882]|uniref:VOC family protein n=1 Tax=Micromonospora sp. WMMD882 TaxID=3015151 RepID=UPI00248C1F11|nr:VOC family protein [Micromonospora sp. WMMD882]WBB79632.1 VOC family protein [Micromonospora sp. WMMD882]